MAECGRWRQQQWEAVQGRIQTLDCGSSMRAVYGAGRLRASHCCCQARKGAGRLRASHSCCQAPNLPWAPIPPPHAAARSRGAGRLRASHSCCQAPNLPWAPVPT
ncbi:unnamed protein product, partial [Staurois parvus]